MVTIGVKHGDVLFLALYCIYIDELFSLDCLSGQKFTGDFSDANITPTKRSPSICWTLERYIFQNSILNLIRRKTNNDREVSVKLNITETSI